MREIKFRAWEKNMKQIIPVYNISYEDCMINKDSAWRTFDEIEIMQFTGQYDKNNKPIYEGDILKLWRSVGRNGELRGEYGKPLVVEYCNTWCQFVVEDKALKNQYGIWQQFGAFEVIGNIYQNKELLQCETEAR